MKKENNNIKRRLFYESNEREFYWVTQRSKSILIEWAEHKTPEVYSGGEIVKWFTHDFNVRWDNDFVAGKGMIVSTTGKNKTHCLKEYEDDYILIYPYQAGLPFSLELATKKDIEKELNNCKEWGVSGKYYQELKEFIN